MIPFLKEHAAAQESATHMTEAETTRLAATGAVAGLCPTTEANLGDGIFRFPTWLRAGGAFGVGGDSHVGTSPGEELRWLEYVRRLQIRRRNATQVASGRSIGLDLYAKAVAGGANNGAKRMAAIIELRPRRFTHETYQIDFTS